MTRIGLISDTHGFLDPAVFDHFKDCHEIWHIGDFGNLALAEELATRSGSLIRGVYGNIDGPDIRQQFQEKAFFQCEAVSVYLQHIGGYPGRYAPGVKKTIREKGIQLFISGHSHILKVMYDDELRCLHMNPGAAGRQGWHTVRTLLRFSIHEANIQQCEVIEL